MEVYRVVLADDLSDAPDREVVSSQVFKAYGSGSDPMQRTAGSESVCKCSGARAIVIIISDPSATISWATIMNP